MVDSAARAPGAVTWTIAPPSALGTPATARHCPRCHRERDFACTGRFRLNANGRRLDVWLLYRCTECATSWKRPIHERATTAEIGEQRLRRLERNDPELAQRYACELERGARSAPKSFRIGGPAIDLSRTGIVELTFVLERPCAVRLDAALAAGLGASRADVARWLGAGIVAPGGTRLRGGRSLRGGEVVRLFLPLERRSGEGNAPPCPSAPERP